MNSKDPVVIVNSARTPMGGFQGDLKTLTAPALGAEAIQAAVGRAGLGPTDIDEVYMGCVLSAGLGQAPARQAALAAGLSISTACTTVNKMCGSGMQAAILAHDRLLAGSADIIVAGGMESMSNAPYLLDKARMGYRMGHGGVLDHMFVDGLEDAYEKKRLMGSFADDCALAAQFSREEQDAYALESLLRARQAEGNQAFAEEIVPVTVSEGKSQRLILKDEQPAKINQDKIPLLKPAFREGGTVTAANSSSISDGAAALVMMRRSEAERRGLNVQASIAGHAVFADEPSLFATAPIGAIRKVLEVAGWSLSDVDLFEINEAFAVVSMVAIRELGLDHAKVNVNGGACALGHPLGASGARIIVTLLNAMRARKLERGVAALCLGGGESTAIAVEIRY